VAADISGELIPLLWSTTDLLRGVFKASEFRTILLPFTALRRLECLVGGRTEQQRSSVFSDFQDAARFLAAVKNLTDETANGGSEFLLSLNLDGVVRRLDEADLLLPMAARFAAIDLTRSTVPDQSMGDLFSELVRRGMESAGEIGGGFSTPADVTELLTNLLFAPDAEILARQVTGVRLYDPVCGTGGMFTAALDRLRSLRSPAQLQAFGQDINQDNYALSGLTLLMEGLDPRGIALGDTLSNDRHIGARFDYMTAHPPFGMSWHKVTDHVKREWEEQGFEGRFGAGLPRVNDASLLFLQHMVAHMRLPERGGARMVVVFSGAPLFQGAAGSGESEVRRWLIERDMLETVVALPDQLFLNTGVSTYIWILSNRKEQPRRGNVLLLDCRRRFATVRGRIGDKRKYITSEQIADITRIYLAAIAGTPTSRDAATTIPNATLGYQRVVIDRPLRQHFEVSADAIATVETAKVMQRFVQADELMSVLRTLTGKSWATKRAFRRDLAAALPTDMVTTLPRQIRSVITGAAAVRDELGEIQRGRGGSPQPDAELRRYHTLGLDRDVNRFLEEEVKPQAPDAWIDPAAIRIGYEIRPYHFFAIPLGVDNAPLSQMVEFVPGNSAGRRHNPDTPMLTLQYLGTVGSAADLPSVGDSTLPLTLCTGGDIVGRSGRWWVLMPGFGDALTALTVLRPTKGAALAICEWLNAAQNTDYSDYGQLKDVPVPLQMICDPHIDEWLDEVQQTRADLASIVATILPNVFDDLRSDFPRLRQNLAATTSQARLASELIRPLSDPVWSAEWAYPFPIATLARQYRIAPSLPQRKEALLKLGESIARTLGVLALSVMVERNGSVFPPALRGKFGRGATFGTWTALIRDLVRQGPVPELTELNDLLREAGPHTLLLRIQRARNESGHAYGVRAAHELEEEINTIEPVVVAALESVSWLSQLQYDLVDRCEYTGSGFKLIGRRLRGSHPEWEPFERLVPEPVAPGQVYVNNLSSPRTVRLEPVAKAQLCLDCRQWELFVLNDIHDGVATFRSGRDHEIEQDLP
jgi:type I restriction enzyme M protein